MPGVSGQVTSNPVSNAQGNWGYEWCTLATNYAVYPTHAGTILYDPGFLNLQYDSGVCTVR
jgi:hypothetical protein